MKQDFERVIDDFNKGTKYHKLELISDNGVNRLMRFAEKYGSSVFSVTVMQTHGKLAYMGDMGDFCFSNHNADMLAWFNGNTSLQYIDEKCRAGVTKEYDAKTAEDYIKECVLGFCEENCSDYINADDDEITDEEYQNKKSDWINSLTAQVLSKIDFENEYTLYNSVNDVEIKINDHLTYYASNDDGYIDSSRYTYRFLWCVLAMNKVAKLYFDKHKHANNDDLPLESSQII